tara:strand:- start:69325 stop:70110 length:786 start_codon:yes stop_codon:yes gene_type:complete
MNIFLWLIGLSTALYLLSLTILTLFQRNFIYRQTAAVQRVDEIASFRLQSDDAELQIWQINPGQEQAIIYFGGNYEKVALKAEYWQVLFPNHTVYLNEYRGYGESTGKPQQSKLYQDALNLYDALAPKHQSIDVIGRSLGAAMAIYVAAHRQIGRLVMVTPFDSLLALVQRMYRIFPVGLMLKDHYPSIYFASKVTVPTLVVIAANDRVVPPRHAWRLLEALPKGLGSSVVLAGHGHNHFHAEPVYEQAILRFFNQSTTFN